MRLVSAAEQLFAAGGEESTSLRAIARAARANAASVHYHFRGRDELLRAVLDRHLGSLNAHRATLLESAVDSYGDPVPLPALLDAALRPDLELLARLRKNRVGVARLLGRAHTLPGPAVAGLLDREFALFLRVFSPALRRSLPDLGPAELRQRLRLMAASVAALFATAPTPCEAGPLGTDDVDEQVAMLVAFCAGGLAAPATMTQSPAKDTAVPRSAVPERKRRKH